MEIKIAEKLVNDVAMTTVESPRLESIKPKANSERGSTMVEYALLVALMAIGSIGAIGSAREGARTTFIDIEDKLAQATFVPN
ncbi:MAG: Flp family type IVb pilin [Pirellulaceae bacterium]|nr:Flp family type IVb pilin [Pirellulaceae bacterium]